MHNHKMPLISLHNLLIFIPLVFFTHFSYGNNNDTAPDQDTLIQPFRPEKNWGDNPVYKLVEEMPRFPGCEDLDTIAKAKEGCSKSKMIEYVYKELKYPAECKSSGLNGIVVVSCVVDTSGFLENISVEKSISPCHNAEAMRVVNSMNYMEKRWISGRHNGEKVRVIIRVPIRFKG